MVDSLYILACALTLGQVVERGDWQLSPQLARGQELIYAGTYVEEAIAPNVRHQKQYRLETTLFVLNTDRQHTDVAVMTALSEQALHALPTGATAANVPPANAPAARPVSVRLELGKIDVQGRIRTADNRPLSIAVHGPSTLEVGFLVEAPLTRVGKNAFWEVNEEGHPARTWQAVGTEPCGGVTCLKLVAAQQSPDWDQPRADQTAWRRKDTVWLAPQLNVAMKVVRTIERRDPAHQVPTQRATVRYELESKLRYPGRMFDDRQREIFAFKKFRADAAPLFKQPVLYRPQLENLNKKLAFHLDNLPSTPYRKALLHFKSELENAVHGEIAVETPAEEPVAAVRRIGVGERVPDFVVVSVTEKTPIHRQNILGHPTLVVFYNPATGVGREVMLYAKGLFAKQAGNLHLMAMAVTTDTDVARKQHAALGLPFPILDGQALRRLLSVDNTPHFVVLDAEGIVRWESTGWGYHIPGEIAQELVNCRKH